MHFLPRMAVLLPHDRDLSEALGHVAETESRSGPFSGDSDGVRLKEDRSGTLELGKARSQKVR